MKEEINHRVVPAVAGSRFKIALCLVVLGLAGFIGHAQAQCMQNNKVFSNRERVEFDVYFKWGLLSPRGASASITITESEYNGIPAWKSELLLNTTGMVDKMFRIRDTITNYVSKNPQRLLFSTKRSNEGGYYQIDNLTYSYKGKETHVHAFRRNLERIKNDTVLVGGDCVLDILGSIIHARSFDWNGMEQGQQYSLQVAMGKSVIPISYRYEGQRIVDRDKVKFSTRYFIVDIYDEAFTESKEAMEIWIGDDENHLPIKVRAKLKIGAMEAYYSKSSNLRYPLKSRVEIPQR